MVSADDVDALLPQTQCTRCGYPACFPYAEAVAAGEAAINRCPPGGEAVIRQLADLLGVPAMPLDPAVGEQGPRFVARIDEQWCIGCTVCIRACPVDAIVGAGKFMHTVIADECSGCELCVAPCPVDCIRMLPAPAAPEEAAAARAASPAGADGWAQPWSPAQAALARRRHRARAARSERLSERRAERRAQRATHHAGVEGRQAEILAAVARVRARRGSRPTRGGRKE